MAAGLDDGGVEFVIIVVRVSMEEDLLGNLVMALLIIGGVWTVETWVGNELVILLVLVDAGDVTADPCTSSMGVAVAG